MPSRGRVSREEVLKAAQEESDRRRSSSSGLSRLRDDENTQPRRESRVSGVSAKDADAWGYALSELGLRADTNSPLWKPEYANLQYGARAGATVSGGTKSDWWKASAEGSGNGAVWTGDLWSADAYYRGLNGRDNPPLFTQMRKMITPDGQEGGYFLPASLLVGTERGDDSYFINAEASKLPPNLEDLLKQNAVVIEVNGTKGFMFPSWGNYLATFKDTTVGADGTGGFHMRRHTEGNTALGDILGGIATWINPLGAAIGNLIGKAAFDQPITLRDVGRVAISTPGVASAIGSAGASLGEGIGSALEVTDTAVQSAINTGSTAAITNAAGTLLSGGDFGDAIKAGIIGGVAAGTGAYVKGVVNEAVDGQPANYGQDGGNTPDNAESYLHDKPLDNWYDQQTVDADGTFYNPPLDSFEGSDGGLISIAKPDTSVLQPVANTVSGAAGGATSGLIISAGYGTDIVDGVLTGAAGGAASGAVKDLGGSDTTATGVSNITKAIVADAVKDETEPVTPVKSTVTAADTSASKRVTFTDGIYGFGSVLSSDLLQPRSVDWTKRKFGG